jgi:CubicO group peptidase (beta-lactamase class C family)
MVQTAAPAGLDDEASAGLDDEFEMSMDSLLRRAVDTLPGCVVLARRGGSSYHKAFGFADMEGRAPMTPDALFRMYSMTKVFTSALALKLHALTGELACEDLVSDYIPSFGCALVRLSA